MSTDTLIQIGIAFLLGYVLYLIFKGLRSAGTDRGQAVLLPEPTNDMVLVPPMVEPDFSEFTCAHPREEGEYEITVLGRPLGIGLGPQMPLCPRCTEQWMDKYSCLCNACDLPICPGMHIYTAAEGSNLPLVHASPQCVAIHKDLRPGVWGQGKAHWFEKKS